jgi:tetratricopeptide (TPR) repeat protein
MNLAFLLYDRGDHDAAMLTASESLEMYRVLFADSHPAVASRLTTIGTWHTEEGDYARAEPMLRDALAMRKHLLGNEHPKIASSMAALARLYLETNRVAEAQSLAHDARLMSESTLSADHWRTAWAASIEGASFARLGEYEQAETMLLNSYTVISQSEDARPTYVEFALASLVQLYEDWDKESQAAEFRGRLVGAHADGH